MKYYHVTSPDNFYAIIHHGVLPEFARGKRLVSWWVEQPGLWWALTHVSAIEHIDTSRLVVFYFDTDDPFPQDSVSPRFVRFATKHVFLCRTTVPVQKWVMASKLIYDENRKYENMGGE